MTKAIDIRIAEVQDLPACAQIINDYIDATYWLPRVLPAKKIAALFVPEILEDRKVFVAENDSGVVGYLTLTNEGVIPALYLEPKARGHGVGKALLDKAKAVSSKGIELTVFEPNESAQRFYAREGFKEMPGGRVTNTDEGVPTLRLRWQA